MIVLPVADPGLGNRSYLIDLGDGTAAVVDPRRHVDEYVQVAGERGLVPAAALETHLHADFVSGSAELRQTGAEVMAASAAALELPHRGLADGDTFELGRTTWRVLGTPGHTPEHVSYLVTDPEDASAVFSGGSLIVGGAARTDLVDPSATEALARDQYRSLQRLSELPDATALWPTHGAGSFCSAGPASDGATTIGAERRSNPLLGLPDEDAFVRHLLDGYGSFPPYFLELRALNRRGPTRLSALPTPAPRSPDDVVARVSEGAWLVDARPIGQWAEGHPVGAVSIELRPAFASWLGWVLPFGAPFVLLVDETRVEEAAATARGIGYDDCLGYVEGGIDAWAGAGLPVATVDALDPDAAAARAADGDVLVDVRLRAELAGGSITGAVHLELGDIIAGKSPEAGRVVTFCGHGERSATAASLLERRGVGVANLVGGIGAWRDAGLPVS